MFEPDITNVQQPVVDQTQFSKNPESSSSSIFDHSALLLMSVSMSFMEVNGL